MRMKNMNSYSITKYDLKKEILNLRKKIENLSEENNKLIEESEFYKTELNKIVNSKTWKLTEPIRKVKTFMKKPKIVVNDSCEIRKIFPNKNFYKNFKQYNSVYEDNIDFSDKKTDIKTLVFYLPQFHTFKENDNWWGKGFTEWTNTKKSIPRFEGHYQPRVPHDDFGYYTLDNIETIEKQIKLAKEHGIYGFCYYYYWFSGKRLMEKPLDLFLKSDIDFPFCLCWANENWTRSWDGLKNDILIKQDYDESDYKKFIKDIKKYVVDKRYIYIDSKPVIMIYNPKEIPNLKETVNNWRKYARKLGIGFN